MKWDSTHNKFISCYNGFYPLLAIAYPEIADKFPRPPNFWKDISNVHHFFEKIRKKEGIKEISDLRNILREKIELVYQGRGLFAHYPDVLSALKSAYPEINWDVCIF